MVCRRVTFVTALVLAALVFQFLPFQNVDSVAAAGRCNWASFVADITVRDGTAFMPGVAFIKTWRLKNVGTCAWTDSYSLVFVSGDPLGGNASYPVPATAPGQMADVSLNMNAPTTPGHYRGYWMLAAPDGTRFGLGTKADKPFWVDINVSKPGTPTPEPGGPGLYLKGTVRRNGVGVAGVKIYRGYASLSGVVVATTGSDGTYQAAFAPIPGDETITVRAELAGYSFEPAQVSWRHYYGIETKTVDFIAAPGTPAPFPGPGAAFDFGYRAGEALWTSGAGLLTYPGVDGEASGYVYQSNQTTFEDGSVDAIGPNLVVGPQNVYNGYVQGLYPAYTVQKGDRLRTTVGCAYAAPCYATFKITYRLGSSSTNYTFWTWTERNEGKIYHLDKDLSALAGKQVTFTLAVLAAGSASSDRVIWGHPRIVHTGTSPMVSPVPTTVTPVPTTVTPQPTSVAGVVYDFTAEICAAKWMSGASLSPQACPFSEGEARGFAVRVENPVLENGLTDSGPGLLVGPQNKYNGYLQGFYPEYTVQPGDHFQASVGCASGSACYVTYRLDYQINNGAINILWQWSEKNDGKIYQLDKDLSSLAGKKVRFILTLLAAGPATNDRAIWGQPRLVNTSYVPPTPTSTPEPSKVTAATANVTPLNAIAMCGQPNPVGVSGTITVSGATAVTYHWEMGGDKTNTSAEQTVSFPAGGTYSINEGAYKVDCGNYTAQLVITSPNAFASEIFHYSIGGKVTNTKAFTQLPATLNCAELNMVGLIGEIGTDGPAQVTYHWEYGKDGVVTNILPERVAYFTYDTTLNVSESALLGCGNYFARLVVTKPNTMTAQVDFPLPGSTLLPIYDFNTFQVIGAMECGEVLKLAWTTEACNGESGGCWISVTPLFGKERAGFQRHEGNAICQLNLP